VAGLLGGVMVGLLANPDVTVYLGQGGASNVAGTGLFFGNPKQLLIQLGAALTVIVWDALVTFVLLKLIGLVLPLRMSDAELETGDVAVHDEEAYPQETLLAGTAARPAVSEPAAAPESIRTTST
jgi:Amt family ammonium transporter